MARTVAIGAQDFSDMIKRNSFYVDKTNFIKEWWESQDTVTLIARPRRFGKTLTMNMLYHFFSVRQKGRSDLFENLNIWKEEKYRKLQGTYPVIFLSFASVKARCYKDAREGIIQELVDIYDQNAFLLDCGMLTEHKKEAFRKVNEDMSDMTAARSLKRLCDLLFQYYGKKAIILLDEYDTPMQEAYVNGYWKDLTDFMSSLLNAAFKTNPHLERGILTGITRISKESVFSDLNNLEVVTMTSAKYDSVFGFTEAEVRQALEEFGLKDQEQEIKRWYDGFHFGNRTSIYNPWSITQFLDKKKIAAYWANTSSNELVGNLIRKGSPKVKMIMEDLMQGGHFCTDIDEQIVFDQLDHSMEAVWSLLLAGGYLKIAGYETADGQVSVDGDTACELAVTNLEILFLFRKLIHGWFDTDDAAYNDFIKALLANDLEAMNVYMNKVTLHVISSFDSAGKTSETTEPERFYHGLVLGLMVDLDRRYMVTSNRESGLGRYDVLLEPRDPKRQDGMILEFKVCRSDKEDALPAAAEAAICQILDQKYASALEAKGVSRERTRIYGFAFRGKEVLIQGGYMDAFC